MSFFFFFSLSIGSIGNFLLGRAVVFAVEVVSSPQSRVGQVQVQTLA
jgi:hypothetical protein